MFQTLTRKILVVAIPVFIGITIAAVVSILNILAIEEQVAHLGTDTISQVRLSMEYQAQLQRLITEVTSYTYTGSTEELEEAEEIIEQLDGIIANLDIGTGAMQGATEHAEAAAIQQRRIELLVNIQELLEQTVSRRESRAPVNVLGVLEALEELEGENEELTRSVDAHLREDVAASQQEAIDAGWVGMFSIAGALMAIGGLLLLSVLLLQRQVVYPVRLVSQAAVAVTHDDLTRRVTVSNQDEIGTLQQSFNHMVESMQTQRDMLEQRNQELASERAALEKALAELQQSSAERTTLLENTVDQLSAPILPVQEGVLVMPIIGAVNEQRAQRLQETLLQAISTQHARIVIIDVTGLTSVDTAMVQALLQTIQSTLLLGARPIVVGINPAMASTLVQLGAPLANLHTMADLEAAVAFALHHNGRQ